MREILFRGKTYGGEWVEGYLYKRIVHLETFHQNVVAEAIEVYDGKSALSIAYYTVDANTIGQFTGLTDKNGTKIFEGDIVESQYTQLEYLVCFGPYTYQDEYEEEQEACGWYNQDINGCITAFGCPESWATVIGNIHDNPELIGGKEE